MGETKTVEVDGEEVRVTVNDGEVSEATIINAAEKLYEDLQEYNALDSVNNDGHYHFPAREYEHEDSDEYEDAQYMARASTLTLEEFEELLAIIDTRERRSQDIDIKRLEPNGRSGGIYMTWDSRE